MIVICERIPNAGRSHGGHRISAEYMAVVEQEVPAVRVTMNFEDDATYQFRLTRDECRIMAARLNEAAIDA